MEGLNFWIVNRRPNVVSYEVKRLYIVPRESSGTGTVPTTMKKKLPSRSVCMITTAGRQYRLDSLVCEELGFSCLYCEQVGNNAARTFAVGTIKTLRSGWIFCISSSSPACIANYCHPWSQQSLVSTAKPAGCSRTCSSRFQN